MFQINVINFLSEIHFHYLVEQIGLIHYSHPSVVSEPSFSHCPPHLLYMLQDSRLLKQVHDVQRRLVDLHEQRIFFGAFLMVLGASSVMIGTSASFSSLTPNSSGQRRAHHVTTCQAMVVTCPTCWSHPLKWHVFG